VDSNVNHLDLFRQAKLGDRDSLEVFAGLVIRELYAYIYRLTLNDNLASDLTQETILEMLKSIKKLEFEHKDQLWSWLVNFHGLKPVAF
jgi:RNA polymerase sigma-70 factor (ECF subfamily)